MTSSPRHVLLALALALAACGRVQPGQSQLGESCTRNADCAVPFLCTNGLCSPAAGRQCEPGDRRCDGTALEECDTATATFAVKELCATGCSEGACLPPTCAEGDRRCQGGVLEGCRPDRAGWTYLEVCAAGCDATATRCAEPECLPYAARCDGGNPAVRLVCASNGAGFVESACPTEPVETACSAGECLPKICTTAGAERERRCRGDVLEMCDDTGTRFVGEAVCPFGCDPAGATAACAPAACEQGEERCGDHDALERCAPDRQGFAFVQFCPNGCAGSGGVADCVPPVCSPLVRRCAVEAATGASIVEQCSASGSGFTAVETCSQGCAQGVCTFQDGGCVPGDGRCNGADAQQCVRLTNGGTEWRFVERCLGACVGDVCGSGGACGCAGGVVAPDGTVRDRCGVPTREAIRLQPLLQFSQDGLLLVTPVSDGRSTFLFHTDPIASATGGRVPDGTLVTFAVSGPPGIALMSVDADGSRPGLQRPTSGGRARVVVRAPASPGELVVTASAGSACSGTSRLRFTAAGPGPRSLFIAEDFSSTRLLDRAGTGAQWDTRHGRVFAAADWSFGSGGDGDLVVRTGTTVDLVADWAPLWGVTSLGGQEAIVDASALRLAPGDEVILAAISGPSASVVGRYEFKRVAQIEGQSRIVFTEPIRGLYGAGSNLDLGGHRVVVQRVPQFNDVTVETGGTLTASSSGQGGSGLLVLRARGTVRVLGTVHMTERGLSAGVTQPATDDGSMSRLLLGQGGSRIPGGGVVALSARRILLRSDGSGLYAGQIQANSLLAGAGGGGSIWLQAGTLGIGTNRVTAQGATGPLDGRIRLDYGTLDGSPSTVPAPFAGGQSGAFFATSLPAYVEVDAPAGQPQPLLRSASLYGVVGGSGAVAVGLPSTLPGGEGARPPVNVDVIADGGASWVNANSGRVSFSPAGRQFRFRLRLETLGDDPVEVYGLALGLTIN